MTSHNPSIVSHVSLGTRNMQLALAFYDPLMATIGASRQAAIKIGDEELVAVAYGREFPEFWIQLPDNKQPAQPGNGIHLAFSADSTDSVHRFHRVALEHGGTDNGAPGPRPHYGEAYYGCFVIDPDGNRIEATYWDAAKVTAG